MKRAVFAGTFDPLTIGHEDIIKRASKLFDELHVVVCFNSEKKSGMFTPDERIEIIRAAVEDMDTAGAVVVGKWDGLLVDYAAANGIGYLVRGARNGSDFDYESGLAEANRQLSGIETVIFPAKGELAHQSSTIARDMIRYGRESVSLSSEVIDAIKGLKK